LRGHGKSQGERYHVDKFDDYVADLERFVALAQSREPGLPLFVLGHSAGGVIACLYALAHQKEMAGLICEDFAHELPPPEVALALLKGVSHLAPHAHLLNLKDEYFSRDPQFVADMKKDPLIVHAPGTVQLLAELVRADERLEKSFPQITLPILILHGTGDRLAKQHGSQRFFDTAGSKDKTLKLYEGHFHDLLNDVGKEEVIADIIAWMMSRLSQ
jgi:alpha-beta hydrolase superfamily lysophospholipase